MVIGQGHEDIEAIQTGQKEDLDLEVPVKIDQAVNTGEGLTAKNLLVLFIVTNLDQNQKPNQDPEVFLKTSQKLNHRKANQKRVKKPKVKNINRRKKLLLKIVFSLLEVTIMKKFLNHKTLLKERKKQENLLRLMQRVL